MKQLILICLVGFSTSQAFAQWQSPNNVQRFNPYISTAPVDRYERVIRDRQDEYNRNKREIQELIYDGEEYLKELRELNTDSYNFYSQKFYDYLRQLNNGNYDLAKYGEAIIGDLRQYIKAFKAAIKSSY